MTGFEVAGLLVALKVPAQWTLEPRQFSQFFQEITQVLGCLFHLIKICIKTRDPLLACHF